MTQNKYKMPDFLIIGAQKAGTTTLYVDLTQHPNVARAKKKELMYFTKFFDEGIDWYRSQFPSLHSSEGGVITGEATPNYLDEQKVPGRVYEQMPDVKCIVLLRNPVDRAYSQYQMGVRKGRFDKEDRTLSFAEMIEEEKKHPAKYRFLSRSIYMKHLKNWLTWFPRKQFLILKSEDFFAKPSMIYREVTNFLALPDWEPKIYRNENREVLQSMGVKADYPDMPVKLREGLKRYFEPYNQQLYRLIGRDLGWDR